MLAVCSRHPGHRSWRADRILRSRSESPASAVALALKLPAATISLANTTAARSGIFKYADISAIDIGSSNSSRIRRCSRSIIPNAAPILSGADTTVSIGSSADTDLVRPRVNMKPRTISPSMASSSPSASFGLPTDELVCCPAEILTTEGHPSNGRLLPERVRCQVAWRDESFHTQ